MLEQTEQTLTKFRAINRKQFYDAALDFRPADPYSGRDGSYYGHFNEEDEIYILMYNLHLQLDEQIFRGHYSNAYTNPLEPIRLIQELREEVEARVTHLQNINNNHGGKVIPVKATLDSYLKLQQVLDYVLGLSEVKEELGDPEKETLKAELIRLKTEDAYRTKRYKMFGIFTFYMLCLFSPLIFIVVLWKDHQNGKWFQLGLTLLPFIGFLYDRDSFMEMVRFSISRRFRQKFKVKIEQDIMESYS